MHVVLRQHLTDSKIIGCCFDSKKKMRHDNTRYSNEAYFVRRPFLSFVSRAFNRDLNWQLDRPSIGSRDQLDSLNDHTSFVSRSRHQVSAIYNRGGRIGNRVGNVDVVETVRQK